MAAQGWSERPDHHHQPARTPKGNENILTVENGDDYTPEKSTKNQSTERIQWANRYGR